jgi:single stranded DNA-binding protein
MSLIVITGNVGLVSDPHIENNNKAVNFQVAVNERFKQKGEWIDNTVWYSCVRWVSIDNDFSKRIQKGDRVTVIGKLTHRPYRKNDGSTGISCDIAVQEIENVMYMQRMKEAKEAKRSNRNDVQANTAPQTVPSSEHHQDDLPY